MTYMSLLFFSTLLAESWPYREFYEYWTIYEHEHDTWPFFGNQIWIIIL